MRFDKDPDATLDYVADWTEWLEPIGDAILSVLWLPSPGLTVVSQSNTARTATAFVSGGLLGNREFLTCRITTVGGRTDDRTFQLRIKQK